MTYTLPSNQAYLYVAPSGVPGDITRVDESSVEPAVMKVQFPALGAPAQYVTGGISPFVGGETNANFAGVLIREVPSISGNTNQNYTDNIPNIQQIQGLMVRGYVAVICTIGTPVRGGIVYIRVVAASGKNIGDFEATADGSNNVALTGLQAQWATDGKDANSVAELRVYR